MKLVDIGGNLTNKAFKDDRRDVVARAGAGGVASVIVTGTTVPASVHAREIAMEPWPIEIRSTAGIHPHHASSYGPLARRSLAELGRTREVVAMGECGLDYNRNFSTPAAQRAAFEAQLELAREIGKPVFLHERDAHEDFVEILARHRHALAGAVVHCFTGTRAELERYLELDLHIGLTGWICDERRGKHLVDLVPRIPADRLMIETDAPYLLPRSMPGRPRSGRNEPAFLTHVLRAVAQGRGEPEEDVARATTATARRFFGLTPERDSGCPRPYRGHGARQ